MKRASKTAFLLAVVIGVALPFLPLLLWSFSRTWFYPHVLPSQWGLRAWSYVFSVAGPQILLALRNSIVIAALTAIFSVAVAAPAGRALGLFSFRGKKLLQFLFILPIIVPSLSVAMGLHLWFLKLNLIDSLWSVILIHSTICVPYALFVMWGVFSNYDPDYERQARSLGASRFKTFFHVTLPLVLPGLIVALLFSFLLSWSQYLNTLIIGGGKVMTLPVLLFSLMTTGDRPVAAAVSLVIIVPACAALAASAKFLGGKFVAGSW